MGETVPVSRLSVTSPKSDPSEPASATVLSGAPVSLPPSGCPLSSPPHAARRTRSAIFLVIALPRRHRRRDRRRIPAEVVEVDGGVHEPVALVEDDERQRELLARLDRRGRLEPVRRAGALVAVAERERG